MTPGPSPDYPQFPSVLTKANRRIHFDEVLADSGYDSERNHRWARLKLKIPETIIPACRHGRMPATGRRNDQPTARYRCQMQKHFPKTRYRQRSQVESIFSRDKRLLDSFLRARTWLSQKRECFLRVLVHNLLILAAAVAHE